jgi:superfamily II DNA or RNA helicase
MELRHYQQQAIDEVKQHFSNGHKKVLMQMPTGAGKTVTFAHIVKGAIFKSKKVLILAHRRELISQAFKTLQRLGIPAGVIMSGYNPDASQAVQIGSIQTIIRRLDIIELEFDLIIVDECHHAMAKSFGSIFARYPNAYILGVTATPCRVDGKGLGDIFSKLVHGLQISELIEMGSLISPNYYCTPSHSLDTIH